jgi:hypothetical protein
VGWAFWSGTVIFAVTMAGMLWLGRRRVPVTVQRTRHVLSALSGAGRLSARELRRRVRMGRDEFYDLMNRLERRHLVRQVDATPLFFGYQLTDDGEEELVRPIV